MHNGFLASDPDGRQMGCNGCSLTMYAPNLNLIRDPRWGRAQEVYGEGASAALYRRSPAAHARPACPSACSLLSPPLRIAASTRLRP